MFQPIDKHIHHKTGSVTQMRSLFKDVNFVLFYYNKTVPCAVLGGVCGRDDSAM